jgi:hypothetical protein
MSNAFYNHTDGVPVQGSRGVSATMRNEFDLIQTGFDITQNYYVDTGTANAMVISPSSGISSLADGLRFWIKAANATSGATTVNLGSTLGTVSLKRSDGTAITSDIKANDIFLAVYSSTYSCLVLVGTTKNYTDQLAFGSALPAQTGRSILTTNGTSASWAADQTGNAGKYLKTDGTNLSWAPITAPRSARTSNTILGASDNGTLIDVTSGTFTQTFTAAATLGSGWYCWYRNNGSGDVTLDPNASETIDGLTSFVMYPGEARLIQCDGTAFYSIVIRPFYRAITSTMNFVMPPGYSTLGLKMWGGGAGGNGGTSGAAGTDRVGGGGGGGGGYNFGVINAPSAGTSITATIGAGGTGKAADAFGGAGGGTTSFGSYMSAFGGGSATNNNSTGGGGGGALSAPQSGYDSGNPSYVLFYDGSNFRTAGVSACASFGFGGARPNSYASGTSYWNIGCSEYGGSGAGGQGSSSAAVPAGKSMYGATGGGQGGGVTTGNAASAGAAGGGVGYLTQNNGTYTGSSGIGGGAAGGNSAIGTAGSALSSGSGGGGGGGGGNAAGTGYAGGDGAIPGGGGGGGGGGITGGVGGNGARGEIRVWGIA